MADPAPVRVASIPRPQEPSGTLGLLGMRHDVEEVDDRARRRARALLSGLTALQLQLLDSDAAAADALADLRDQLRDLPPARSRELAAVVDAIAVRVAVELARHSAVET